MGTPKDKDQSYYLNILTEDIFEAIQQLKKDFSNSSYIYKQVILLEGQWNDLQKQITSGFLSSEDQLIEKNKIRAQLISVIEMIGKEEPVDQKDLQTGVRP